MSISVNKPVTPPITPKTTEATAPPPPPKAENKVETKPAAPEQPKDGFETQGAQAKGPALAEGGIDLKGVQSKAVVKPEVADIGDKDAPKPEKGVEAAKDEVKLKTVATTKEGIEKTQEALRTETNKEVDDLFAMADGKKDVPKGMEVKKVSDTRVEVRRKDDQGNLSEFTQADRGKDKNDATINTATFKDGVNTRERVQIQPDGRTKVEKAGWEGKNEAGDMKSLADIQNTRDPKVSYSSDEAGMEKDDGQQRLMQRSVKMENGGVSGSRTAFWQQDGGKHIDNKLKGPFDFKKKVDRSATFSYDVPPPGKDGKQEPPSFHKVENFSQGNVTATSYIDRTLDGHTKFAGQGAHTVADFEKVRDEYSKGGGQKWDADKTGPNAPPKRWTVDLQENENTLKNQTFIEGHPDASISTTKTRDGSTIKESYEGKTFDPDSKSKAKYVEVKGETEKKYGDYGTLDKMHSEVTEPDGSKTKQDLETTYEKTSRGLESKQTTKSEREKDGKTEKGELSNTYRLSNEGEQLVKSSAQLTNKEGLEAFHEVGEDGERMTLKKPGEDVRDVADPEKLEGAEKELMSAASISNLDQVASAFANGGAKSIETLKGIKASLPKPTSPVTSSPGGSTGPNTTTPNTTTPNTTTPSTTTTPGQPNQTNPSGGATTTTRGNPFAQAGKLGVNFDNVKKFGGPSLLGAGGIAGFATGILNAQQAARQGNNVALAKGVTDAFAGVTTSVEAGLQFKDAIKNVPTKDLSGLSAGSRVLQNVKGAGALGVAGGALGIVGGALDIVDGKNANDNWQVAKGAVNLVGGAIGIGAALAGGPIGLAVGGAIALGTFVFGKIADAVSDKPHKIAELTIDDKKK